MESGASEKVQIQRRSKQTQTEKRREEDKAHAVMAIFVYAERRLAACCLFHEVDAEFSCWMGCVRAGVGWRVVVVGYRASQRVSNSFFIHITRPSPKSKVSPDPAICSRYTWSNSLLVSPVIFLRHPPAPPLRTLPGRQQQWHQRERRRGRRDERLSEIAPT